MTDPPHTEPWIPVWWNRFRILGSIGLAAIFIGVGTVRGDIQIHGALGTVLGAAIIIVGFLTVLLSAAMWSRSRTES